ELEEKKANLRKIAEEAKAKNDFNTASKMESQIIALDTSDTKSFITLSKTLKKQHHAGEALSLLQTAEKLSPTDETIQLEVAKALIENNKYAEGIQKLQSIKTLRNKEYYNALGVANDVEGNHKAAQEAFDAGLKLAPDDGL